MYIHVVDFREIFVKNFEFFYDLDFLENLLDQCSQLKFCKHFIYKFLWFYSVSTAEIKLIILRL
jgi:hypothetical protein